MKNRIIMEKMKAFTLVELLVVIGIIALLISVLLPSLNKARQAAWRISCQSQMKQVALGMLMYANDNRNTLPLYFGRATNYTDAYAENDNWIWLIARYLNTNPGGQTTPAESMSRLFTCPAYHPTAGNTPEGTNVHVQRTYALSFTSDNYFTGAGPRPFPFYGVSGLKLNQIKHPVQKALILDIWYTGSANLPLYGVSTCVWSVNYDNLMPLLKTGVVSPYPDFNKAPHSSGSSYGTNIAYCDGHVEWTPYDSSGHLSLNIWDPVLDYNF